MSIEDKLLETALEEISSRNLQISSACKDYLADFIRQGSVNLKDNDYSRRFQIVAGTEALPAKAAEDNLKRFVNQMIGYALANDAAELHEDSFWNIRNKVCPLFPFC